MEISFKALPFDVAFHPSSELVAVGLISGRIHLYNYAAAPQPERVWSVRPHRKSSRGVRFVDAGRILLSVSKDCSIQAVSVETGQLLSRLEGAHEAPIYRIVNLTETTVATGDDNGTVKVWDVRQSSCCCSLEPHSDYVSDMEFVSESMQLLSVSGDGTLAVNSLRRNKVDATSEFSEDELLSVVRAKNGSKVICGSQEGVLLLYSWGEFADCNDRFVGHPNSVDALLKWDEDTLITGSSDGMIRVVSILPNKMVGVIGEHEEFPVERLAFSHDRSLLGSISHENTLKLWDLKEAMKEETQMVTEDAAEASNSAMQEDEKAEERRKRKGKGVAKENPFFADL